jgi:hypothetical protein
MALCCSSKAVHYENFICRESRLEIDNSRERHCTAHLPRYSEMGGWVSSSGPFECLFLPYRGCTHALLFVTPTIHLSALRVVIIEPRPQFLTTGIAGEKHRRMGCFTYERCYATFPSLSRVKEGLGPLLSSAGPYDATEPAYPSGNVVASVTTMSCAWLEASRHGDHDRPCHMEYVQTLIPNFHHSVDRPELSAAESPHTR